MNGGRSLQYVFGLLLVVLVLAVVSCSSSYEQAEIAISSDVKAALEDVTPAQEYSYYTLTTAHPEQIEDLSGMTLLVCGDIEREIGIDVAASFLTAMGTPLFQTSKVYFINEIVSCEGPGPCASMKQDFDFWRGREAEFHRELQIYGSNTSDETLLAECIEAMRQHPETVLLVKKGALGRQDEVVEVVFK